MLSEDSTFASSAIFLPPPAAAGRRQSLLDLPTRPQGETAQEPGPGARIRMLFHRISHRISKSEGLQVDSRLRIVNLKIQHRINSL